jgi:hypothetical protein
VSFPVENLDAYERRARSGALFGGVAWLVIGIALNASEVPSKISILAAAFAVCLGVCLGLLLWWVMRPGTRLAARRDAADGRWHRDRSLRAWTPLATPLATLLLLWLGVLAAVSLIFATDPFPFAGVAGWTAGGVAMIVGAPATGKRRRDLYEADLTELGAVPERPDA